MPGRLDFEKFGKVLILLIMSVCVWLIVHEYLQIGDKMSTIGNLQTAQYNKTHDRKSKSKLWAEDSALNTTPVTNHMTVANASRSVFFILNQKPFYRLGEEIHVLVELFNGYGRRRTTGGDMVRVWMRDSNHNASSAALVRDNHNGSYTATLVAFWVGTPEIKAVLIYPKELIDTFYRRRLRFPQVFYLRAVFEHPVVANVKETTVCNIDESIPEHSEICNLTRDNYNSLLYCVKPSNPRLQCRDWTKINKGFTWPGNEPNLTQAERFLLQPQNKATFLPRSIVVKVEPEGSQGERLIENSRSCFEIDARTVWNRTSPIGYFYKDIWYDRLCARRISYQDSIMKNCIKNRSMYLLGDSTSLQWYKDIQERINCTFVTDKRLDSRKERLETCVNRVLNFTLRWGPHGLPFSAENTPKSHYKPTAARIDEINGDEHVIVVIGLYAHFMSYHSKVYYNRMATIKDAIIRLFHRCPNVTVAIKGPFYYSFEKNNYTFWFFDKNAEIYTEITKELMIDISDRVIYLDGIDITISAETNNLHPSKQTVGQMVDDMLSKICP